jgi:DNA-binding CsgD family transcriptional regulator/PAS domain-containing protein
MIELSPEKLNELVTAIYDAALDPDQWQTFVQKLSLWADGAQIVMHGHDFVAKRPLVEVAMNLPPELLRTYYEHYAAANAWVPGIARMQIGTAGVPEAFLDRESLFQTEYYNDWLRPMDIGTAVGIVLHRDASRFLILSSNLRIKDEERLRQPLLKMLDLLGPHITRSFAMARRLAAGEGAEAHWRMAENSPHAVMLLDRQRRVVQANGRATKLLDDRSVQARDRSGAINFLDPVAQAALEAALEAIMGSRLVQFTGEFTVRGRTLETLAASVIPLRQAGLQSSPIFQLFDDIPIALLVVQSAQPSDSQFRVRYALTPAEAALVNALAHGQSLTGYAEAKGLSVFTVRAQLKAVFAKTNVHRQGELVALFMRSAAPDRQ